MFDLNTLSYRNLYFPTETPITTPAPNANVTMAADINPAISVIHTNGLARSLDSIREIISVNNIKYVDYGDQIDQYKSSVARVSSLVAEGVVVPPSKAERKKVASIPLVLHKRMVQTTVENVMRNGEENALNEVDRNLIAQIQDDIFQDWIDALTGATGTAGRVGKDMKAALAYAKLAAQKYYLHRAFTPLYVISGEDMANYQADHQVTLETQSGLTYVENFLQTGGTTLVLPSLDAGKVYCTAKENVYLATLSRSNVLSNMFGMTADELGLIFMKHTEDLNDYTRKTHAAWRTKYYFEEPAGICYSTIATATEGGNG